VISPNVLYLSRTDVEKLTIPIEEVIQVVEKVFNEKAEGKTEAPPKPGIHPGEDAFIHAMPAYLSKTGVAGVKWVSGFPQNPGRGFPYISGLLVLNDVDTGFPTCVMDCTWITAKRTGAATALAARNLAREDSEVVGILGCGTQGRSNLEALRAVLGNLEEVKAYDTNEINLQTYVRQMMSKYELRIVPVSSPRKAVENCDVVVTSGPIFKHPEPVIEKSWFRDGGFACALDFDSYWKAEAMHSMNKFCTDDRHQLDYYKTQGYFSEIPSVYADLSEIVSGQKPGREGSQERIMSMNLGLAIEDIATAALVYEKARKAKIGTILPL
jgi:ornithine cyclodeaminase/alanine dehydrogenase-like protein (mu-crystallin family)